MNSLPPISSPSKGYGEQTGTIITGVRWWDVPHNEVVRFTSGGEVLNYHETHVKVIDAQTDPNPTLEVYLDRDVRDLNHNVYLRYEKSGQIVEESLNISVKNHPEDPNTVILGTIYLYTRDMGDGVPFYDYSSMSGEGMYEIVVRAYDENGDYISIRIPFRFINLESKPPTNRDDTKGLKDPRIDEYYVAILEGVTPFNKRPATPYRAAGIGILKSRACVARIRTEPRPPINRPADEPVVGTPPSPPCAFRVSPASASGAVGDTVTFSFSHANQSGVLSIDAIYDHNVLDRVTENSFYLKQEGVHEIHFTALYEDGQECVADTVFVEVVPPPIPSRKCGEQVSGGQGYASYQFDLGDKAGEVTIEYDFYGAPDVMEVFDSHGNLIHRTPYTTYTDGSPIRFYYEPSMGKITIVMNDGVAGSAWEYKVNCPK